MNKVVERFIPLVDFLGEILGDNTEIILHDLTKYEQSVVHIINGHITNRKIGDSVTDFVFDFITKQSEDNKHFVCKYSSRTSEGKLIHSSTYFIRDDNGQIVGALGVNSDYEELKNSLSFLSSLFPNYIDDKTISLDNIKENLSSDYQGLALNKIDTIINQFGVEPQRMSTNDKTQIITTLNECGIFDVKGSVQEVAEKLEMSEPSVYRYLKKIKTKE